MVPLITGEITIGHHVCEMACGVNMFDLALGSKFILSNNQSSVTRGSGTRVSSSDFTLNDDFYRSFIVF